MFCVIIVLFAGDSEVHRYHNVAELKTASQSSSYGANNPASLAVDDSPSTCARTDEEKGAWWKIDLGQRHIISHLRINMGRFCAHNFGNNFFASFVGKGETSFEYRFMIWQNLLSEFDITLFETVWIHNNITV